MKRTEAVLFVGVVLFVSWLLAAVTQPRIGFVTGVAAFIVLIGFILLLLIGRLFTRPS